MIQCQSFLTDNIIHEWWHAISELLRVMKYGQQRKVRTPIPTMYGPTEEREAVAFVGWAFYGKEKVMEPYFKLAIKEFNSFSVYDQPIRANNKRCPNQRKAEDTL